MQKRRIRTLKTRFRPKSKSIFDTERGKPKALDLSGRRSASYAKRKLSLIAKARLAAAKRRQPPFKKRRNPRRRYLKRRL